MTIFWIVCGLVHYGASMAYWQREYTLIASESRVGDRWWSGILSIAGPMALASLMLMWLVKDKKQFKHGFLWW